MAVTNQPNHREAVELLQQLGLKEYEARCFVALSRLPRATAKEISEISEVPRTRVYDATRVLESKGLVETQHASPKQFRAIPTDDAVDLLRAEYRSRADSLRESLQSIDSIEPDDGTDAHQSVWTLSNTQAITNRTLRLVEDADSDVVLVVGHEDALTDSVGDALRSAHERGVSVVVGATTDELRQSIADQCPENATVSLEGTWVEQSTVVDAEPELSRVLLVDRDMVLISMLQTDENGGHREEAVLCYGSTNGIVTIVRRAVIALLPTDRAETVTPQSRIQ